VNEDPWQLPGPRRWLTDAFGSSGNVAVIVLRLPCTLRAWSPFEAVRLANPGSWFEHALVPAGESLVDAVREMAPGAQAAAAALGRLGANGTTPWLRVETELEAAELSALGEAHHNAGDTRGEIVVEHVGGLNGGQTKPTPTLRVRHFYGIVSPLDVQVMIEELYPNTPECRREEIVELAAHDLELVHRLATIADPGALAFHEACQARAAELGIEGGAPELPPAGHIPTTEPRAIELLWQQGAVDVRNGDAVMHSGVLDAEGVQRRLWRGQVRSLLPLLDEMRLRLIEITRRQDVFVQPLRGDIIELADLARSLERRSRGGDLARAARALTFVRNELSHLRPVDEEHRAQLLDLLRRAKLSRSNAL
jgi:hypothetical protein